MGRENAAFAKTRINFIHRDFFDFRHDYKFDELITDMPVRNRHTKAEMELFYERFFDKASEHLVPVSYTHLRLSISSHKAKSGFYDKLICTG